MTFVVPCVVRICVKQALYSDNGAIVFTNKGKNEFEAAVVRPGMG